MFTATIFIAAAMFPAAGKAQAGGNDPAAIQSVISGQIGAFQADDGAAAYSAASPGIQALFPSVGVFMSMVSGQYQPVYRPRSVVFGPLDDTSAGPVQSVFLTGPDGLSYTADCLMQRQPDGSEDQRRQHRPQRPAEHLALGRALEVALQHSVARPRASRRRTVGDCRTGIRRPPASGCGLALRLR